MKLHESDNRGGIVVKLIQRALAHIYIHTYSEFERGSILTTPTTISGSCRDSSTSTHGTVETVEADS